MIFQTARVRNKFHALFKRTVRFYVQHLDVFVGYRRNKFGTAVVLAAFVDLQFHAVITDFLFIGAFIEDRRGLVIVVVDMFVVIVIIVTIGAVRIITLPIHIIVMHKAVTTFTAVIMVVKAFLADDRVFVGT